MNNYKPLMYYSVMTSNRGDMAIRKSITETISKHINISFAFFDLRKDELTEQRILNQLNKDCSALILAGSGIYSNYTLPSGFYFNCKSELFNKIKVPIFLIGLGANKNLKGNILCNDLNHETKKSIKLINDLSMISTVRDRCTYDMLSNLDITKHELMLDPACFLNIPRQVPKQKQVAIQIAQHSPILGRFDGGEEGQKNRKKNIEIFAKISKYLIDRNYNIIFIAHDALENSLIIDLQKLIPEIKGLNTDDLNLILEEYAKSEFVLSVKMHSAIMAFASGTPSIQIYYDQKSIEYLKMLNCEELGISIFTDYFEILKEKVDMMINNLDYYTNKIIHLKQQEQIKFDKLIGDICTIIKTTP